MRSSAIAEELIARGEEVSFVGEISNLPWVKERIVKLGFAEIHKIPKEFISKSDSDVLILDSYQIPIGDPFIGPSNWLQIVAVVDKQTPNYFCDLRIHPALDASWIGHSTVPILAGPLFIPLRAGLSKNIAKVNLNHDVLRIAVVAGGSDPYELVIEIAMILAKLPEMFEVLLFSNPTFEKILDSRFQFIEIGERLDELTQNVDLILTTSSTSSLEFLARGLCIGVVCAVDNQKQNYDSLGQLGAAAQIGFRNSSNKWELDDEMIHTLVTSPTLRQTLKANSAGLIDFNGARRIVDAITSL